MHVAPASLHFRHSGDWRSHYITRQLAMIDSNSSKRCILFVSFSSTLHMPEALKSPWVPILTRADVSVIGPARLAEVLRGLDTAGGVAEHQAPTPRRTSSGHGPKLSLLLQLHAYPTLAEIHHTTPVPRERVISARQNRRQIPLSVFNASRIGNHIWLISRLCPRQLSSRRS